MKLLRIPIGLLIVLTVAMSYSCTRIIPETTQRTKDTRHYDSAFPDRDASQTIERIFDSVKRIQSTIYYNSYLFDRRDLITVEKLQSIDIPDKAIRQVDYNQSTAGTAIVVGKNELHTALLTCAHVVTFPDTVVEYYTDKDLPPHTIVKTVAIKRQQINTIFDLPFLTDFEIIAKDDTKDIALLGVTGMKYLNYNIPSLQLPSGDAGDLEWGSFVYILGYPKGYQMVTRAIVSKPNDARKNTFYLDALFNHGISGGLIIAARGGIPNFEWVGLAKSTAASQSTILAPDPLADEKYDPFTPYEENIFVKKRSEIEYGITQTVSINEIRQFFNENQNTIVKKGYRFIPLFTASR